MSVLETYATWRVRAAARPYLYRAERPVFSFFISVFAYVGGFCILTAVLGEIVGQTSASAGVFSKPYWGVIFAWLGACSWWGERRNWRRYVASETTEMMLGPIAETGETK